MPSLEEAIRRRAYELWEAHGCPDGREQEFWYLAEREVMANEAPAAAEPPQPANVKRATKTATAKAPKSDAKAEKADGKSAPTSATKTRAKASESASKKAPGTGGRTAQPGKTPARGNPPSTGGKT